jgi:ascorbate PTS system EIIB component
MSKKLKVITVCGNGLGSSLMLKGVVEAIFRDHGVDADVDTCDFSQASSKNADYIITVKEFTDQMRDKGLPLVTVRSFVSRKKVEEDMSELLAKLKGE